MKKAFIVVVCMFLLVIWPCGGLWGVFFRPLVGGGIEQSFLYPIYAGIVLLAGIIAGCTDCIIKELRASAH